MNDNLMLRRIGHVRPICESSIEHDRAYESGPDHWTDRHWLAQSVLNILDGNIDPEIREEMQRDA